MSEQNDHKPDLAAYKETPPAYMQQAMEIIMLPITEIKPYWRNPRNNERAIQKVMKSIEKYGFNQPLVLDKDKVIIVGHSRFKALMNLGWESIPSVISSMSASKAKEYRIIDNKTSEFSEWDYDNLMVEVREFENPLEMQDFFDDIDLTEFVEESAGVDYKDPTEEDVKKEQKKLGEVFQDRQKAELSDYIEVICPECGETFSVSRQDLLTRLK